MENKKPPKKYTTPNTAEETKIIELIVFNLGDEEFGAAIAQIREIIRIGPITPIPTSPDFIQGVTNVRGEVVIIINLKARFSFLENKEVESKHIIITEQGKNLFGLMVDEVTEVLRVPEKTIKAAPDLVARIDNIFINGVLTIDNRLIILLDLAKVLSETELIQLAQYKKKQPAAEKPKPFKQAESQEPVEVHHA